MGGKLWVVLVVAGLLPARAFADPRADARTHYQHANKLYDLQKYAEAAVEYEAAYELVDDPALLFNIGQSYRFAAENQKAIGAFKAYLRRLPRARNHVEVEARIDELQQLIDQQRKSLEAPPSAPLTEETPSPEPQPAVIETRPPPPTEAPPGARTKKIAGLAVGAVGVVGLGIGAAFAGLGAAARHDLSHPSANTRFDPALESRMKLDRSLGAAFLVIGGACLVSGVVVGVLGLREGKSRRLSISPSLGPAQAGLAASGDF